VPEPATVTLRFWASARAAAGSPDEQVQAATLAEALAQVVPGRARLAQVLQVCSFVVDGDPVGSRPHDGVALAPGALVDVLPPFAGG
jgi:molybdopterin synthase sulfur carrier subunit